MHGSPVNPRCKITVPAEADLSGRNSMSPSPQPQGLRSSENAVVNGNDPERFQIPYGTATSRDLSRRSDSSPRISLVETVLASPKIITRKQHSDRSFPGSDSKNGANRNSTSELRRSMGSSRASHEENIPPANLQTPCTDRSNQQEDDSPSPIAVRQILLRQQGAHSGGPGLRRTKPAVPRSRHIPRGSGSTGHPSSPSMSERHSQHEYDPSTDFEDTETPEVNSMRDLGENETGLSGLRIYDVRKQVVLEPKSNSTIPIDSYFQAHAEGLEKVVPAYAFEDEELQKEEAKLGKPASPLVASHDHLEDGENTESNKHPNVQGSFDSPRLVPPPPSTPVSEARLRSQKSIGSAVKAMAARFEGVSNDEPSHVPGSVPNPTKPSGIRPQYTVNPSPSRSSKSSPSKFSRLSRSDSVHSGRPPWIAVMHGRSKRLSVGEPHQNPSGPVSELRQSKGLGENCLNSSQGAMAQGTDGAYDFEPFSCGDQGGSEETIAHVGRVVTVAYQPLSRIGTHRGEHAAPSVPHHLQGRKSTQGVQQTGFGDYACMPRLPPRSSLRLPPHALKGDVALSASKMEDEPAKLSNANHIPVLEAFESQNADVPRGNMLENLQQQLRDKTDEANHLRSLLGSGSEADIAILREQLRLVRRECLLWRTKAEVAEKRVATFKRLAARVKALRAGEGTNNIPGSAIRPETEIDEADDEADVQDQGMRRVEQWLEQDRRMDSSGEHTEDGAVVAARIRESLRAMEDEEERTETTTVAGDVAESHYDREDEGSMSSLHAATTTRAKRPPPQGLCRHRYRSSGSDNGEGEGISAAVANMWVAAEGMF